MKKFKKMMALLLACVMMFAMGSMTVFAASITINRDDTHLADDSVTDNTEYKYYKIFDAVVPDDHKLTDNDINDNKDSTTGFTYRINKDSKWINAVEAATEQYLTLTDKGDYYLVELKSDVSNNAETAKAMAEFFKGYTDEGDGDIHADGTLQLDIPETVEAGYYLIITTGQPDLVLATTDVTIYEKNDYPKVEKKIAEEDKYAQIGKDVTFTVKVTIPQGTTEQIVLKDEMSEGLTYKQDSMTIKDKGGEVLNNLAADFGQPANGFTITIPKGTVEENQGGQITVEYQATVNSKAVVEKEDTNTATIEYGNYSQYDTAQTNENSFTVRKYDGADADAKTPIAGAIFQLKNGSEVVNLIKVSDTVYRVADTTEAEEEPKSFKNGDSVDANDLVSDFITVEGSVITINGVDSGIKYTLTELKAPDGFNANTEDQPLSVNADNTYEFGMENNKGTELPSTGGIGTTIFYVIGAILVIGAGVLLVTRRRMKAE